jgi:MFS transporter, ACS family, D-galactonate transporter
MSSATVGSPHAGSQPSFTPALVLLGLAIVINYIDRGNLSFGATLVQTDLGLSATKLGVLLSGFFYTYTALQFVIGGVVDRCGANRVLSAGLLLWSLATIATGFAGGFVMLFSLRLLLGVGESVAFPCTSKVIAENVSQEGRGLANGVITAGLKLGPAIGAFGGGMLIAKLGWRSVFLWTGILSLFWLPAWFKWMPKPAASTNDAAEIPIGYLAIFRQRGFWGCSAGHFCFNYLSYFLMTWLPFYLGYERHLSQLALSKVAGTYYLLDSAAALSTGWLCDQLIRRGARASFIRKAASVIGSITAAVALMGCAFAGSNTYFAWLLLAAIGSGAAGCGVFLFAQTLAGPKAVGRWSALQNGVGNFAGLSAPALTGFLVDKTGHFFSAFALCAAVCVAGALVWSFAVKFVQVDWSGQELSAVPSLSQNV